MALSRSLEAEADHKLERNPHRLNFKAAFLFQLVLTAQMCMSTDPSQQEHLQGLGTPAPPPCTPDFSGQKKMYPPGQWFRTVGAQSQCLFAKEGPLGSTPTQGLTPQLQPPTGPLPWGLSPQLPQPAGPGSHRWWVSTLLLHQAGN